MSVHLVFMGPIAASREYISCMTVSMLIHKQIIMQCKLVNLSVTFISLIAALATELSNFVFLITLLTLIIFYYTIINLVLTKYIPCYLFYYTLSLYCHL